MDKLTLAELQSKAACDPQTKLFEEVFGEEMPWDEEHLIKAVNSGLNSDWFVLYMLTPEQRKTYRKLVIPINQIYQLTLRELSKAQNYDGMVLLDKKYKEDKVLLLKQITDM